MEQSEIYNPEDDLVELFHQKKENINEVSYFKRGSELTIGGGIILFSMGGYFGKLYYPPSIEDENRQEYGAYSRCPPPVH